MNRERLSLMTFNFALDLLFGKMRVLDVLELAQEESIPFVDLMNVRQKALSEYLSAMDETGARAGCYIASISFFGDEDGIRERLRSELETATELSAQRMMIVPYSGVGDLRRARRIGRDSVAQTMINGFQIAVQEGRELGMPVCFELTPHDELCLSGTEDCLRVLRAVDGLGLVFDTANMLPHGEDPIEAYEQLSKYVVHVHLKDVALEDRKKGSAYSERTKDGRVMRCVAWGRGVIPVDELYRRLVKSCYPGLFAIEYSHPSRILCGPEEHRAHLRQFLECGQ